MVRGWKGLTMDQNLCFLLETTVQKRERTSGLLQNRRIIFLVYRPEKMLGLMDAFRGYFLILFFIMSEYILCSPVSHEYEGRNAVKRGHQQVCYSQVHQEVVGHAPHGSVS